MTFCARDNWCEIADSSLFTVARPVSRYDLRPSLLVRGQIITVRMLRTVRATNPTERSFDTGRSRTNVRSSTCASPATRLATSSRFQRTTRGGPSLAVSHSTHSMLRHDHYEGFPPHRQHVGARSLQKGKKSKCQSPSCKCSTLGR